MLPASLCGGKVSCGLIVAVALEALEQAGLGRARVNLAMVGKGPALVGGGGDAGSGTGA